MGRRALLVTTLVVVAACGGSGTSTTSTSVPVPPSTAAPATTAAAVTTTTAPPPTSTVPPSTTTTAPPAATATTFALEPWMVVGQRYYFPIQPPDVTSYSATHHDYPATDIFGPEGSIVVAITDGVIDEVSRTDGWDPDVNDPATRGGLYVSLIGDDGIRYYYSHLLALAPRLEAGDRVRGGQIVGLLGRSGNAAFTSPHVHFGISPPTFAGDWEVRRGVVPPYDFLQAWTVGTDLVPTLP